MIWNPSCVPDPYLIGKDNQGLAYGRDYKMVEMEVTDEWSPEISECTQLLLFSRFQ